jgi:hypothetical protein
MVLPHRLTVFVIRGRPQVFAEIRRRLRDSRSGGKPAAEDLLRGRNPSARRRRLLRSRHSGGNHHCQIEMKRITRIILFIVMVSKY